MSPPDPATRGSRRTVLVILLLFAAPLGFAFWLYYGTGWRPALRTNHGTLIEPVVVLPQAAVPLATAGAGAAPATLLTHKWSLVVIGQGERGCDAHCRETLVYARQTWLSMGKNAARAQRVLLAGPDCCDAGYLELQHAGLTVLQGGGADAERLRAAFPLPHEGAIFVVDPLGNLMMRYDVRQDPKGLRDDLAKLLELSHIG